MWIPRFLEAEVKRRALARPMLGIVGTRRIGKTALARRVFPRHSLLDLGQPGVAEMARRDPSLFLKENTGPLILDNMHFAPELLRHLVRELDRNPGPMGHYILTVSTPSPELREVAEAFPGRVAVLPLGGLSASELRAAGLTPTDEELLLRGGFPELHLNPGRKPRDFFRDHAEAHRERCGQMRLKLGQKKEYDQLLRAVARRTAGVVNRMDLSRELIVSQPTAATRLDFLIQSGLVLLLEPWADRVKMLVKSPKLRLVDTGLACFWMGIHSGDELRESPWIEELWQTRVFLEMKALREAGQGSGTLLYWANRYREADFLLHRPGKTQLADAQWTPHPEDVGPLELVRKEFVPPPPLAVFCRTPQRYRLSAHAMALPLSDVGEWLNGKTFQTN